MKKRILIFSLCAIAITILIFQGVGKKSIASTMTDTLVSEGYPFEKFTIEGDTVEAVMNSSGLDNATAEDILTTRRARNEARTMVASDNKGLEDVDILREVIKNKDGKVIYESKLMNAFVIPAGMEPITNMKSQSSIGQTDLRDRLSETFTKNSISIEIKEISKSQLEGYYIDMEITNHQNDSDYINEMVPRVQELLEELNTKGAKITEYTIAAKDMNNNNEVLLLMSADLLYRDFLWWQSPEFKGNTWTKSGPEGAQ